MKKFFLSCLFLSYFGFAAVPVIIENHSLLSYVKEHLPQTGLLKQTEEGFIYIELPSEYVFETFPLIEQEFLSLPPYFGEGKVGAHITVATREEIAQRGFPPIPHLGEQIPFSIVHFAKVLLAENSPLGTEAYLFLIEAPMLEEIRAQLGLSPKIKDYEFHITVAVGGGSNMI